MTKLCLSVLIPLYNEEELVGTLLDRVVKAELPEGWTSEVIVVDDGSTDGSDLVVEESAKRYPGRIRLIRHASNRGKGAAVRTA
ncbi:MAG: glycosyltransferase family 2 protein, partial [Acidobacteriota bacterium]